MLVLSSGMKRLPIVDVQSPPYNTKARGRVELYIYKNSKPHNVLYCQCFLYFVISAKYNTFCCSRFELLQSLTENGKDILYFEEEVGPFLLHWMAAVIGVSRTKEFLSMLVNVIKFNAAYVDEDVISGLVQ
jgi:hypothetical protein